jgi:hypothetical protein
MAFMSVKSIFMNMCLLHANLVIAQADIEFGEALSTLEFIQKVIND